MNPKQLQIIETFGLGQSVVAGAGCGKTTTLVEKCLTLLKQNPQAKFCAVSFTEKSVRDLKEALVKRLDTGRLGAAHWVKTIHGLCYTILQEFPVEAGLHGGETILLEDEASRLWERSIELLWTSTDQIEISASIERLLKVYNREQLESLLKKLRSLMSFGVEDKITTDATHPLSDVWKVFQSVYLRFLHAKSRQGGLDFNDLELLAFKALQNEEVSRYYQKRFDLVLVDEFQDTNPLQAAILERFVKPDFSNLCIVGDPKQSIYRFRDADVSVFQDLSMRLPSKHLLDTNYRSRPGIIEFVNTVCAPTFQASGLDYEPLEPGRIEEEANSGHAPNRVSKLEIDTEEELALYLRSELARGVDLSEYVILARSIRKEKILKFLRAMEDHGVPFLLGSGGRFYSDPRVQECVALLRGWISPKNTLSQVTFLRAPWIGISDPTLFRWKDSYFTRFFEESSHPIALALKPYFSPKLHVRPGQILEACLACDDLSEELYLPLVSLWHKAEDLSRQGRRFEEIVQYFSKAIEDEKIEKDIPAPAERGMVRVLTVHSAKGLQFPRVILLDFAGEYKSSASQQDLIWDRKRGVHLYHRDEEGTRDASDPKNIQWAEIEKAAQVAESKRVFYVALTRAQEELILVWKREVKHSKASEVPGFNPHLSDNWRAWIEASKIPETKIFSREKSDQPIQLNANEKSAPKLRMPSFDAKPYRPRHSPSEWLILNQCEYRYQLKFVQNSSEAETQSEEVAQEEQDGAVASRGSTAEKGERIHGFLETSDWEGLRQEFAPEVQDQVVSQIQATLERGSEITIYPEFGFEVPLSPREALVGMMDRLEVDFEKKTIRIIDYKFTAKPKVASDLLNTYSTQLKLYLWAASKLVDFSPSELKAELIHFTERAPFTRIPLEFKSSDLEALDAEVKALYERALFRGEVAPRLGEHCRYCEFTTRCPVFLSQRANA